MIKKPRVRNYAFFTAITFNNISSIEIEDIETASAKKIPPKKVLKSTRFYCLHTMFYQ